MALPEGTVLVVGAICGVFIMAVLSRLTRYMATQAGGDARLPLIAVGADSTVPRAAVPVSDDDWEKISNASRSSNSISAPSPRPAVSSSGSGSSGGGGGDTAAGAAAQAAAEDPIWSPRKGELLASFLAIMDPDLAATTSMLPAGAVPNAGLAPPLDWESAKEAKGVSVHTAAVAGNEFRALKAVGLIHAPPDFVAHHLMQLVTLGKVDDMLEDCRVVHQV